jgi:SOS-response transcriptional repressor LexA
MNYTPKQLEILRLIKKSQVERGYSPTYAELAKTMNVSPVSVFEHVAALEKKGAIRRRKYEARSLEITDSNFDPSFNYEESVIAALEPLSLFLQGTSDEPGDGEVAAGLSFGDLRALRDAILRKGGR